MTPTTKLALAVVLILGLGGCAVQRPTAKVESASLTGVTLSTLEVTLDMKLDNPNDFEIPLERIDWILDVWGDELGRGDIAMAKNVPANGSADLAVPLAVTIGTVASAAAKLIQGKDIDYGVHGDLIFSTALGPISVGFEDFGMWDNPL